MKDNKDLSFGNLMSNIRSKYEDLCKYIQRFQGKEIDSGFLGRDICYHIEKNNLIIEPTICHGLIFRRLGDDEVDKSNALTIQPEWWLLNLETNNIGIDFFWLAEFTPLGIRLDGLNNEGNKISFEIPEQIPEGEDPILHLLNSALSQAREVIDEKGTTRANAETIKEYENAVALYNDISACMDEAEKTEQDTKLKKIYEKLGTHIFTQEALDAILKAIEEQIAQQGLTERADLKIRDNKLVK